MRELSSVELNYVSGGVSNVSIISLTTLGGTFIGSAIGALVAIKQNTNLTGIWQLTLFPVWVAASSAVGGFVGMFTGFIIGIGSVGIKTINSEENG